MCSETQSVISDNANHNNAFFDTEMNKLAQCADGMKLSLDKEIKDLDVEIRLRKSGAKKCSIWKLKYAPKGQPLPIEQMNKTITRLRPLGFNVGFVLNDAAKHSNGGECFSITVLPTIFKNNG